MKLPLSTYRLQMNCCFPLREAERLVDYFVELGIGALYLSPLLQAKEKSRSGYDLVDPSRINGEIASEEEFIAFSQNLQERGLSILLDIVPNHMCVDGNGNSWWNDLLRRGKNSPYAEYFDLYWEEIERKCPPKLGLPLLGGEVDEEIARGNLRLVEEGSERFIAYCEKRFPLSPATAHLSGGVKELLKEQFYALEPWEEGEKSLSYRRFFDVTPLASLSMEKEAVFEDSHKKIADWIGKGVVTAIRVDHIDGLLDPEQYLSRLRRLGKECYLVVEKITMGDEALPPSWPVQGSSGYDFSAKLTPLYIDSAGFCAIEKLYREFTGREESFEEVAVRSKIEVMKKIMRPEIDRLVRALQRLVAGIGEEVAREVVHSFIAALGVYRTYVAPGKAAGEADRRVIAEALKRASLLSPKVPRDIWESFRDLLEGGEGEDASAFTCRLQQTTGAVMAKGVEDTANYRYTPLASLNEVGMVPLISGDPLEKFHRHNMRQSREWRETLLATTTHDSKRSEDVRARIDLLSEIPIDLCK